MNTTSPDSSTISPFRYILSREPVKTSKHTSMSGYHRRHAICRWESLNCHRWAPLESRGGMWVLCRHRFLPAISTGGDVVKFSSSSFSSSSSSSPLPNHHHHHLHLSSSLPPSKLPLQKECYSVGLNSQPSGSKPKILPPDYWDSFSHHVKKTLCFYKIPCDVIH